MREQRRFVLQVCRSLLVSACSSALRPPVVPASSPGMQLPSIFLLPWGRGRNTGVLVWACHDVRAERSKWILVLLPPKPSDDASQSFWCGVGCRKAGAWKLWGRLSREPRAFSCTAPAAVPRKNALIQQFYCVLLFRTL